MDVLIVGAGGHGKVVAEILRAQGTHRAVAFLDADPLLHGSSVAGIEVRGAINLAARLKRDGVAGAIVAVGDNAAREAVAEELLAAGLTLINAIHPAAVVAQSATIGQNVVICAGACVCADAVLGDHVIINTGAVVDHECEIGDAVHVCPGALLAGRVTVGRGAFVGLGAKVIQCLTLGPASVIGAGAVVLRDVDAHDRVVGVPARSLSVRM